MKLFTYIAYKNIEYYDVYSTFILSTKAFIFRAIDLLRIKNQFFFLTQFQNQVLQQK